MPSRKKRVKPNLVQPIRGTRREGDRDLDDEALVFGDADEVLDYVEKNAFPNAPSDALYSMDEVDLSRGGQLFIFEETSPSDLTHRRRAYVESRTSEGTELTEPAAPEETDSDQGQPRYDLAVTFAGEDREYVEQVVSRLREQGVRVFYDADEQAVLWGRNLLEVLVETYRSGAFRVLMFVSAAYVEKMWPKQERRATLERAMQADEPYVLPVLLDDTPVPGLPGTTGHVDGRKRSPVEVADLAIDHLRAHGRELAAPPAQRDMAQRVSVGAIPAARRDGGWEVPYAIHNGSDYPIENVVLVIEDPGADGDPTDQMGTALELVIGTVAAGADERGHIEHELIRFTRDPAFAELGYLATLLFTDHWGNHWAVTAARLLQKKYPARSC